MRSSVKYQDVNVNESLNSKGVFTLWLLTRDPSQSRFDPGRGLINFAFTLHALLSWKIDPHLSLNVFIMVL